MINSKGEWIYTNAEIAYEVGISPATVNACAKRLFGRGVIPHWNYKQAKLLCEYIKSISVEEDAKRLATLHDMVMEVFNGKPVFDDVDMRKRVDNDIYVEVQ